jgi:uncharacterized membrane protein YkvA (DUF1232 family)
VKARSGRARAGGAARTGGGEGAGAAGGGGTRTVDGAAEAPAGPQRGTARAVLRGVRNIPAYLRLLVGLLFDSRVAVIDKILVGGAIAYVISPIGLIPDAIPVIGELDDLFVMTLALQHLVAHADEAVLRDHWTGDPEELSDLNVGRVLAAASFFLPLGVRGALRRRLGIRKQR